MILFKHEIEKTVKGLQRKITKTDRGSGWFVFSLVLLFEFIGMYVTK